MLAGTGISKKQRLFWREIRFGVSCLQKNASQTNTHASDLKSHRNAMRYVSCIFRVCASPQLLRRFGKKRTKGFPFVWMWMRCCRTCSNELEEVFLGSAQQTTRTKARLERRRPPAAAAAIHRDKAFGMGYC